MTLSWTLRLLCILTIVFGLVLASSQIALALAHRWILRHLDNATARSRERLLYLLQIGPALFAAFVAGAVCLPAYVHGETNLESENVSRLCLLVAGLVALWFLFGLLRGLRITLRTLRFVHACRRSGPIVPNGYNIPVLTLPDPAPPVRLIGFFRPLIVVSSSFKTVKPGAFDLALAHERSHATHFDNWKLLTLSYLPRLDRMLPGGDPWSQPWQQAADWAADDDAVQGDAARSLLLAEALVTAARAAAHTVSASHTCLCTALTAADTGLAIRIDRLIRLRPNGRPSGSSPLIALAALALLGAAAAFTLFPWIYALSERLLHL
jgi:hypothetical protein